VVGLGRGILGGALKPVLGAVSGARSLAKGLICAVSPSAADGRLVVSRRRPPRMMQVDGAIRAYDLEAALLRLEVAAAKLIPSASQTDHQAVDRARLCISDQVVLARCRSPLVDQARFATNLIVHLVLLVCPTDLLLVELCNGTMEVRWALCMGSLDSARPAPEGGAVILREVGVTEKIANNARVASDGTNGARTWRIPCDSDCTMDAVLRALWQLRPLRVDS